MLRADRAPERSARSRSPVGVNDGLESPYARRCRRRRATVEPRAGDGGLLATRRARLAFVAAHVAWRVPGLCPIALSDGHEIDAGLDGRDLTLKALVEVCELIRRIAGEPERWAA